MSMRASPRVRRGFFLEGKLRHLLEKQLLDSLFENQQLEKVARPLSRRPAQSRLGGSTHRDGHDLRVVTGDAVPEGRFRAKPGAVATVMSSSPVPR